MLSVDSPQKFHVNRLTHALVDARQNNFRFRPKDLTEFGNC